VVRGANMVVRAVIWRLGVFRGGYMVVKGGYIVVRRV